MFNKHLLVDLCKVPPFEMEYLQVSQVLADLGHQIIDDNLAEWGVKSIIQSPDENFQLWATVNDHFECVQGHGDVASVDTEEAKIGAGLR